MGSLRYFCFEYKIDVIKVTCSVTDIGANIAKAAKERFGKNKHLVCFACSFSSVAANILSSIDGLKGITERVKLLPFSGVVLQHQMN
jgi:hypothetical protein